MTNFELHYLMQEHMGLMFLAFQSWIAITSGYVASGYLAGQKMNAKLCRFLTRAYLIFACSAFVSWANFLWGTIGYSRQLVDQGGEPAWTIPVLAELNGLVLIGLWVFGSYGAYTFFRESTEHEPKT